MNTQDLRDSSLREQVSQLISRQPPERDGIALYNQLVELLDAWISSNNAHDIRNPSDATPGRRMDLVWPGTRTRILPQLLDDMRFQLRSQPLELLTTRPSFQDERRSLLGGRIPREVFISVLSYATEHYRYFTSPILQRGEPRKPAEDVRHDPLPLVCRFWANQWRQAVFSKATLMISTYEDAQIFRTYTMHGSQNLVPLYQLISGVKYQQDYDQPKSFCHLLPLPFLKGKKTSLTIRGGVYMRELPPYKLDGPYWGLPPSAVDACSPSFWRDEVSLVSLYLPSFNHARKYLTHISRARKIELRTVHWYGDTPLASSLLLSANSLGPHRGYRWPPASCELRCEGWSTDPFLLCLTTVLLNPLCPLNMLCDDERRWTIEMMMSVCGEPHPGYTKVPAGEIYIDYGVGSEQVAMLSFAHNDACTWGRYDIKFAFNRNIVSPSFARVIAVDIFEDNFGFKDQCNQSLFRFPLSRLPELRIVVCTFDKFDELQTFVQRNRSPLFRLLKKCHVTLVCRPTAGHRQSSQIDWKTFDEGAKAAGTPTPRSIVGIDPTTLELTGQWWDKPKSTLPSLVKMYCPDCLIEP